MAAGPAAAGQAHQGAHPAMLQDCTTVAEVWSCHLLVVGCSSRSACRRVPGYVNVVLMLRQLRRVPSMKLLGHSC
jgi:hypothetical protein